MKVLKLIVLALLMVPALGAEINCTDSIGQYSISVSSNNDVELITPDGSATARLTVRTGSYMSGVASGAKVKSFTLDTEAGILRVFTPRPKTVEVECSGK
ncbi:hypothetical protein [Bacteriovorax sp. DB6_IX]|uniref:hypothetical protein n=1 Tax=Bacteriovorax sp. DB6_IX TaxID=1353530 RepID=UPI00038A2B88|nr:hypothetical protein [Bacteriovorax sp. DB6_IX]EQC44143.1 hypothetical protein M901_2921 [Bacteriovorax sp. DB6_IX]